jgi:hypothetical protein
MRSVEGQYTSHLETLLEGSSDRSDNTLYRGIVWCAEGLGERYNFSNLEKYRFFYRASKKWVGVVG